MKDLIRTTGITSFLPGQKLSSESLNAINSRINDLVAAMNIYLKSEVNVNVENNEPNTTYTLETVRSLIPQERRGGGLKVRFKSEGGVWSEYVYTGTGIDDTNWYKDSNWSCSLDNKIDGGEW